MRKTIIGVAVLFVSQLAVAQIGVSVGGQNVSVGPDGSVSVKTPGSNVQVNSGSQVSVGGGNKVASSVGEIAPGANIEGVTVINGKLWIDGKEIPAGVRQYKSPKTGKTYKIDRNGRNVAVTSSD